MRPPIFAAARGMSMRAARKRVAVIQAAYRYHAFVSYTRDADAPLANWLRRRLQGVGSHWAERQGRRARRRHPGPGRGRAARRGDPASPPGRRRDRDGDRGRHAPVRAGGSPEQHRGGQRPLGPAPGRAEDRRQPRRRGDAQPGPSRRVPPAGCRRLPGRAGGRRQPPARAGPAVPGSAPDRPDAGRGRHPDGERDRLQPGRAAAGGGREHRHRSRSPRRGPGVASGGYRQTPEPDGRRGRGRDQRHVQP